MTRCTRSSTSAVLPVQQLDPYSCTGTAYAPQLVAGRPAALGPGDGVTRCLVAGDSVLPARNRRDRSHETATFLLRSTGLVLDV
jgi:hypothetical protein